MTGLASVIWALALVTMCWLSHDLFDFGAPSLPVGSKCYFLAALILMTAPVLAQANARVREDRGMAARLSAEAISGIVWYVGMVIVTNVALPSVQAAIWLGVALFMVFVSAVLVRPDSGLPIPDSGGVASEHGWAAPLLPRLAFPATVWVIVALFSVAPILHDTATVLFILILLLSADAPAYQGNFVERFKTALVPSIGLFCLFQGLFTAI